jgi:DNA-binding NarL/FixJ family response regulator
MHFTERENEILDLIREGMSNKQIAAILKISEQTVKNHISNMMEKARAKNRTELAFAHFYKQMYEIYQPFME